MLNLYRGVLLFQTNLSDVYFAAPVPQKGGGNSP